MRAMNAPAGDSEKLNYAIFGSPKLTSWSWPVDQSEALCVSQTEETQISSI